MWCQGSRHLAIVVKTNRQVIFGGLSICPVCRVGVALATGLLSMSKSAVPTWTVNRFKSKHSRIARRCSSAPGSRWRVSATLHIGSPRATRQAEPPRRTSAPAPKLYWRTSLCSHRGEDQSALSLFVFGNHTPLAYGTGQSLVHGAF